MEKKTTHIAAIASPGFSHLAPLVEFAKRFVQLHPDFQFTCIIPTLGSPPSASISMLKTVPPNIHPIFLPPVNPQDLPQDTAPAAQIQLTVSHSLPDIHNALESLSIKSQISALMADPFANEALRFSKEFNALSFIYFPSTAMTLSFCLHLPKLDQTLCDSVQFKDLPEPVEIPGCEPIIYGRDLPDPVQDRRVEAHRLFLELCKRYHLADGILVNSFQELEEGPLKALTEGGLGNPLVYAVGPIINTGAGTETNGSECLRWLDEQPANSVLFVSFGSGGTLSQEQLNELALGLEQSGKKFLWVARSPSKSASAAYLAATKENPLQFLPSGFLERTKDQGLVVPSWAPQIEVLCHNATGGFLSHCGWNSTLESLVNGVPIIAWPLFAEQRMNAKMLSDGLKVALRPKANENGIVERGEIARIVRRLMDGDEVQEIRGRVKELKDAAASALMEDGSLTKTLSKLASHLRSYYDLGG